jgi:prophage regulatory protein
MPQQPLSPPQPESRILRLPDVESRTGFKRAHIYNLMSEGKFPRRLQIGIRAVGWNSTEIDQWVAERAKQRI